MPDKIKAKNTMSSRELYTNRTEYKSRAFSPEQYEATREGFLPAGTVDFWWAERAFVGRINTSDISEPIEPYVPYMKPLRTKQNSVLVLNFVADAFKEFQAEYLLQIRFGNLQEDDPFLSEIEAVKGYMSIRDAYRELQKSFYNSFVRYLADNNMTDDILDMNDFLREMSYYLLNVYKAPFTRSAFMLSRHLGPMASGLCIDVQSLSYSEDEPKIEFINSPNFQQFRRTANQYGFMVDKNVPWRLVANMNSPQMIEYAKQYQDVESVDDIVNKFFVQTSTKEIENLKLYLVSLYNQFVSDNPIVQKETFHPNVTSRVSYGRSPITLQKLNECYSDCRWLELFIKVRNKETGLNYSTPAETAIIRVAKDIQKTLDTREAMRYTRVKFSGVEFYNGSLYHASEKMRQAMSGKDKLTPEEVIKRKAKSIKKVFY